VLKLSYSNSNEINKIIDEKLPGRPAFQRREVIVANEAFELFSRNISECIKSLWGDIDFTPHLIMEPERHYADADKTIRVYSEMNTGKWWWCTQVSRTYSRTLFKS
jgi:Plavaka transposase